MTPTKAISIDSIDRQRNYVESQKAKGHGLGIVFADAFLRGMRDLGYKDPAWSLAEDVDNAIQAGADIVAIHFGFLANNKSQKKPDQLAICDNGNGMIPEMISYAVRWGGTDREGDRKGFGRYGYGLPSSAVSLAKRYTVYSKPAEGEWHAVTVDIDQLAKFAGDIQATEEALAPKKQKLPKWVLEIEEPLRVSALESGTVIVLDELDRLRNLPGWITIDKLKTKLLQDFGVIYRHWVPEHRLFVEGTEVEAVDPLFLMEHARFYNETPVRAERIDTRMFEVETSKGSKGKVSIRASVLPPNFQSVDPNRFGRMKGSALNKRHQIMKDYNGIIICREWRQIDCILPKWTKFQNYDMNVKIEINFDPELDEFFGITTAKQQIVIDDDMWEKLRQRGKNCGDLDDLLRSMRTRFAELQAELDAKVQNQTPEEGPRPSAVAMEESAKFKAAVPEPTPAQRKEARKNIEAAAAERAESTGQPEDEVIDAIVAETSKQRWEIEFASIPEGPFYRPVRLGEQKRLVINTDHPFYSKVYNASASPEVQAAIEVLLFVLAERELETRGDAETFYKAERQKWSERLRHALDVLISDDSLINRASSVAEQLHTSLDSDLGDNSIAM